MKRTDPGTCDSRSAPYPVCGGDTSRSPPVDPNTAIAPATYELVLDRYVPALMLWLSNKLSSNASTLYRKKFNIGVTDWRVLAYLGVFDRGQPARICEFIGMDKAALSRSMTLLLDRTYITVSAGRGKAIELMITAKGRKLFDRIWAMARVREAVLLTGFSEDERHLLVSLLQRMLTNLPHVYKLGGADEMVDAAGGA